MKNYDWTNVKVETGEDEWNAIEHEEVITAIAAARTINGEASVHTPRDSRDQAVLEDPWRAPTPFVNRPVIGAPQAYVEGEVASGSQGRWLAGRQRRRPVAELIGRGAREGSLTYEDFTLFGHFIVVSDW
ncbi:hypothetical protein [Streptomyces yunnanensis]|uniref:Uncharacterized protein n=1 Tax=Streptomyces yunnanensis TaxID=156453 RepID=A0A9X8MUB2_9ACTN|nr:hypothetical protein [Streptomyces yunnanensis]SHL84950.1 hypothetical protein SAMN05216268_106412 [Streptomyces yunnanensis]